MSIQLSDSLSRQKAPFQPLQEGQVGLYVCGRTVYDYIHIGNARTFTTFDMVSRWLRVQGYDVTYVRNVTDIDDKIIDRANERGIAFSELAESSLISTLHRSAITRVFRMASGQCLKSLVISAVVFM